MAEQPLLIRHPVLVRHPVVYGRVYKGPFDVYKTTTVKAVAVKDDRKDSEVVSATFVKEDTMSEATGLLGYAFDNDGTSPWVVDADVSHDGVASVRSGTISKNGMTTLTTSVRKAGTVSFWWCAKCEEPDEEDGADGYYDYASFEIDGETVARIAGHDTGWRFFSTNIVTGGKHVLSWSYRKDAATDYSPDCAWLDNVQWIPSDGSGHTLTTPEQVPYSWLEHYGLHGNGDFEKAAMSETGKTFGGLPMSVWHDYVAGTDPTNAASIFRAQIEMVGGIPRLTWTPDLNDNGSQENRTYTIWGSETLVPPDWHSPTNASDRFFKVTVEMP